MDMDLVKTGILLVVIDSIYIGIVGQKFGKMIEKIQGGKPMVFNMLGAIIAYVFLIIGLYVFIIKEKQPIWKAFVLGLVIYGVYEGTNYAIIQEWKPWAVVLDTLWGGILFAITTKIINM